MVAAPAVVARPKRRVIGIPVFPRVFGVVDGGGLIGDGLSGRQKGIVNLALDGVELIGEGGGSRGNEERRTARV